MLNICDGGSDAAVCVRERACIRYIRAWTFFFTLLQFLPKLCVALMFVVVSL